MSACGYMCVWVCLYTMKLSLGAYTWGGKYVRRGICIVIRVCVRVHLDIMHGFEAVWVHIRGVACVWDICTGVCFVHVGAPACLPGAHVHTFIGQTMMAECGSGRWHTLPFPWHSLKTSSVLQREFFVAKINFLI